MPGPWARPAAPGAGLFARGPAEVAGRPRERAAGTARPARAPLQAVGIDTSGRLQYVYSPACAARREMRKFERVERFGQRLPSLRRRVGVDIDREGFPRERVLAVMLRLIGQLWFRVGTEDSVQRYRTYGITTLRNRHLRVEPGGRLVFRFVGKHHVAQRLVMVDDELAALVIAVRDLRGSHLFAYRNDAGRVLPATPADVNAYIKESMGSEFSSKDFRTWGGSLLAAVALAEIGPPDDERRAKRSISLAVKEVSERLGNTPAVCGACYVHPAVLEAFRCGITLGAFRQNAERRVRRREPELQVEEAELLALFHALRERRDAPRAA